MKLLLLTLTLGIVVADAGNLLYEVQQKDQLPPEDGLLCPDQASRCSNTATCCKLSSGKWGCCPFIRATCCDDNVHCCPNGYMCHKTKGQCVRAINNDTMPWAKKEQASALSESSSAVGSPSNSLTCPDRSICPGTAACCRTLIGNYRCCTFPNDVCCQDGNSCCPRCTICDQLNNRCIPGFETEKWETVSASTPALIPSESTPAAEKSAANVVGASSEEETNLGPLKVVWCNRTHYCRNWQRCCRLPSGIWGCCPRRLVSASTAALIPSESTPAAEKSAANVVGASSEESTTLGPLKVVWCDSSYFCANGQTCCRQPTGNWGCCPYALATCCGGSKYCCPFGKRCSYPPGLCF